MKTLVPKHIVAVSMMVVAAAAPTGIACQNDGSTAAQDDRGENIITESMLQEFRDFHGENKKTVRGRVVAYNPDSDVVTIAKEKGGTYRVGLSQFSDADQAYVRECNPIKEFFNQKRFHISTEKKPVGGGVELMICRQEEIIAFDILLENRSHYDLNGLTLDYCIYHEQEELNYRGQVMSQGVVSGTRNIGTLARGEKVRLKTEPVVFPKGAQIEYYKDNKVPQGKILGLWIRVCLPLVDGNKAMRELSMPNTLINNRKWITPKEARRRCGGS